MVLEYIISVPSFSSNGQTEERERERKIEIWLVDTAKAIQRYSDTSRPIIYQHRDGVTGLYQIPNIIHTLPASYITTHIDSWLANLFSRTEFYI